MLNRLLKLLQVTMYFFCYFCIMNKLDKRFLAVVYTHSIDGNVFYVGMSNYYYQKRPYRFNQRDKKWKSIAKGRKPDVGVLFFDSIDKAKLKERELIELHCETVINKQFNPLYKQHERI